MQSTSKKIKWLPFEEARIFVHTLNLKSYSDWIKYCKSGKKPIKIPSNPNCVYKEWVSLYDWLGNKIGFKRYNNWPSFEEAKKFVHKLNLKSCDEWLEYCKSGRKPHNIPNGPDKVYKNKGWISYSDWIGIKEKFLSFEEAREFVHTLNLNKCFDWKNYCKSEKKPHNIPNMPELVYKNKGWISYSDWINKKHNKKQKFLSFQEAKSFVHTLNLNFNNEWKEYCKSGNKPYNIPAMPEHIYKDEGWISYSDWLGKKIGFSGKFLSFEEARKFVHTLNLKSQDDWIKYCKSGNRPLNIPASPESVYKNKDWKSICDWIGTNYIPTKLRKYRSFEDAREFVHTLNLKNQKEWTIYCKSGKKPNNIPATPSYIYRTNGWISWYNWFGNKINFIKSGYLSFEKAREFVHTLNLKNTKEWRKYCKLGNKPDNIPFSPNSVYKNNGWISWSDWFGTEIFMNKNFISFIQLKELIKNNNIKNYNEYQEFRRNYNKQNIFV